MRPLYTRRGGELLTSFHKAVNRDTSNWAREMAEVVSGTTRGISMWMESLPKPPPRLSSARGGAARRARWAALRHEQAAEQRRVLARNSITRS